MNGRTAKIAALQALVAETGGPAKFVFITTNPTTDMISPCVLTRSVELLLLNVCDILQKLLGTAEGRAVPHYWIPLGKR